MRTFLSGRNTFGRLVARFIVWSLIAGQVMLPAQAAQTALADVPIAAKVTAKPNIVYTLDDSGSMQNNFLPDYVTNVGATIAISVTRVATVATGSGAVNALAVGDYVNIVGAAQPEYNGYFQITAKPTATTFKYTMTGTPLVSPATVAAGYGNIQVVTSSAYCRSGNTTTPCTAQAQNIGSTVIGLTSVTRPAAGLAGGTTATATGTAANLVNVNTGDTLLLQGGTGTSLPYNGSYVVTKTSTTTFTYDISPTSTTPAAMSPTRQFVLVGASFAAPPLHTSDFNRLAYNPEVTYLAPILDTGLPMTTSSTDANGNYGTTSALFNSASVARDPYYAYEATKMWAGDPRDNLGLKVLVPLYCNTDWPALVNDVYWPGGPNGATVLDAGDSNGQYSAGTGGWCRINGTKYDVSVASGAPAVQDDYNYPYNSSSGATGAQYFFRSVGTKTLWCDKTSQYYPRNSTITSCTGGTPVYTAPVGQTCVTQGLICGTGSGKTYNPAACNPATTGWLAGEWCAGGQAAGATGTLPECKNCGCVADTAPSPARKCSLSGLACVVNADCPPYSNTIASCTGGTPVYALATAACTGSPNGVMWDPAANAPGTTTLLADANGAGVVCRHNNFAYAVGSVVPGVATYPRTNVNDVDPANKPAQLGQFTTAATSGCPPVATTVAIPRHYYVVDSVQFCDDRIVTANDQWKGFGTGVCKTNNDLARFKEVKYGKFTRIDLFASNSKAFPGTTTLAAQSTPYPVGRAWLASTTPGPDNSESINYANWYAYYSTRLLAAKTTSSIAFSYLTPGPGETEQYRVGFHNLGDEPTGYGGGSAPIIFVNVDDWKAPQRTAWYNALFGVSIPIGVGGFQTPTIDAMIRIGSLFEKGDNSGVPAEVNPLPGSATDPIPTISGKQVSCQNNFHILFTDGKTNQVSLPTSIGDQDESIPSGANSIVTITPTTNLPILQAGGTWPAPFKQGSPAIGNTLADVATRYWAYDLRPTLKNDVPAAKGTLELDWTKDVAWWQHVSFSAISFGAQGTLDATDVKTTVGLIKAGTLSWPNLTNPNNPVYPRGAGSGAVAVDDLWHATVNSRGSFVYANTPVEVAYGLANILAGIQNQQKSRAAAAFGGQVLDSTNNIIYEATIEPGWAGDLLKVEIDPATGAEVKTWWQASIELKNQILAATPLVDEPWMDETKRRIVTINSSTGSAVPFRFANLSAAQLVSLAKTSTQQQRVIAYLRGGNTFGGQFIEGTGIGQFRLRSGPLGDISNAQAVIIPPTATYDSTASAWVLTRPYDDATDPGYSTFVTAHRTRATRIVAAANDGMVHVFDAGPVNPVAAGGGQEVFAYIPKALFRGTAGAKATEDTTAIQALTYQDGGVPIYKHHMYVDSTPRVADVDFGNGSGDWHSIVVGGLGKGGNSYYALDVSDPDAATEAAAASKVLWEWTDPTNDLKYTYGKPVIVKTRAYGWVVIVTSGYNNVSGVGKLYFLRASDGTLLKTMSTGVGTPSNPSGFAQIHAFVADYRNQIAEQVYGGDLLGNMWRFDVHDANPANWTVDLLARFKDLDSGLPQPVTTAPQIEIDINNGIDRYVFIGTGQLLDTSDFTTTPQRQTFYAIRDGTLAAPLTTGLPIDPRVTMKPVNTDKVSSIVGGAPDGWYDDLPLTPTAERIVVDVQADVNIAAYIGTQAQNDPCVISLPATLYARDFTTAKSLLLSAGTTVPGISISQGAIGMTIVGRRDSSGNQSLGILVSTEIPGTKPFDVQNPVTGPGQRLSWRLLTGE